MTYVAAAVVVLASLLLVMLIGHTAITFDDDKPIWEFNDPMPVSALAFRFGVGVFIVAIVAIVVVAILVVGEVMKQ